MDIAKALRDYEADPSDESKLDRIRRELIRTRQFIVGKGFDWEDVVNSHEICDGYIKLGLSKNGVLFLFNKEPVTFRGLYHPEEDIGCCYTLDNVDFGPEYWITSGIGWHSYNSLEELNAYQARNLNRPCRTLIGPHVSLTFHYEYWSESICKEDYKGDFEWVKFLLKHTQKFEFADLDFRDTTPYYRHIFVPKDFDIWYMLLANKEDVPMIEEKSKRAFQEWEDLCKQYREKKQARAAPASTRRSWRNLFGFLKT